MAGKGGVKGWDATSHEAFLLVLLGRIKPNRQVLTECAEALQEQGYSYTYAAIMYIPSTHTPITFCHLVAIGN